VKRVLCGLRCWPCLGAGHALPAPLIVCAGDKVTAGTVNYDGQISVQAIHSGGDTGTRQLKHPSLQLLAFALPARRNLAVWVDMQPLLSIRCLPRSRGRHCSHG
jgi:hypothetical protein